MTSLKPARTRITTGTRRCSKWIGADLIPKCSIRRKRQRTVCRIGGKRLYYFDGNRKFTESELKSVIVVGECNDRSLVFATLDKLHAKSPFTRLVHLDVYPSHPRPMEGFACQWARQNGVEAKPVRVDWKLGKNAAAIRYGKLFAKRSRSRPDTVVAFTNKEITPQVKLTQKAGVEVVFA
jgi:hypothetical protein